MKICSKCKQLLSLDNFVYSKITKDRKQSWCKNCKNKLKKEWYNKLVKSKHKEKRIPKIILLEGKTFGNLIVLSEYIRCHSGNRVRTKWLCKCNRCNNLKYIRSDSLMSGKTTDCGCIGKESTSKRFRKRYGESARNKLYASYASGARNRNYEFSLSKEEFFKLTQMNCYYCNSSPINISKNTCYNGDYIYNGVDRIDNTKGYVYNNCVSCCKKCNRAKDTMTVLEFHEWITKVYNNLKIE